MSTELATPDRVALERFLGALYRSAPPSAWVEVRFRLGPLMGQSFHPAARLGAVAHTILARAAVRDMFVGVVPRSLRSGRRADLVERSGVAWADCDDADSVAALQAFQPAPSVVIASGTAEHRHAYWLLTDAIDLDRMESINRRLAAMLGADQRSADAARILRPAGSVNRKRRRPASVRLLRLEPRSCVAISKLEVVLPPEQRDRSVSAEPREMRVDAPDPLRAISPRAYVARLAGQRVGRSGKIRCPFHDDKTPSLHVYEDPERGWYCFGCGRGGSVYDLAAMLWQRGTRGEDFRELRRDLAELLS